MWFSDDGGKTYGFGSSLGANLNEATLIELADGSESVFHLIVLIVSLTTKGRASAGVLANIRPDSNTPTRVTAVSTDGELQRLVWVIDVV